MESFGLFRYVGEQLKCVLAKSQRGGVDAGAHGSVKCSKARVLQESPQAMAR